MFTKEEILRCESLHLQRRILKCAPKLTACLLGRTVCFRYFDTDDSGSIDEKEYMALARTVNNAAPMFPANFQSALQQFDV